MKTRLGAQRYNNRMNKIFEDARRIEADRLKRGEEPNPNLTDIKVFDTRTEQGLKAAEKYKAQLEDIYNKVIVTSLGLFRVRIQGLEKL